NAPVLRWAPEKVPHATVTPDRRQRSRYCCRAAGEVCISWAASTAMWGATSSRPSPCRAYAATAAFIRSVKRNPLITGGCWASITSASWWSRRASSGVRLGFRSEVTPSLRRNVERRLLERTEARIEGVPHRIAQQVESQDREEDRQPGERRIPPEIDQVAARLRDHRSPLRRRRLGAEPDEAQPGGGQDGVPDIDGRLDHHGGADVGQEVPQQDAAGPSPERHPRQHKLLLAQRQQLPADEARVPRPPGQRYGDHRVVEAGAEG